MNDRESYYRGALIAILSLVSFVGVMMEIRLPFSVSPLNILDPVLVYWSGQMSKLEHRVGDTFEIIRYWQRWDDRCRALERQNKELLVRLRSSEEAVRENRELKKLLKLKRTIPYPTVSANLICKGGTPWSPTFLLDKGSRDGVMRGMAVVSPYGVMGVVVGTTAHTSRVLGVTSVDCRIHAEDRESGVRGILKGDNAGSLFLHYVLTDRQVKPGDMLLTSGLGGIFPRGYPVARVVSVKRLPGEKFLLIRCEPTAPWDDTHYILVLKRNHR